MFSLSRCGCRKTQKLVRHMRPSNENRAICPLPTTRSPITAQQQRHQSGVRVVALGCIFRLSSWPDLTSAHDPWPAPPDLRPQSCSTQTVALTPGAVCTHVDNQDYG
ncbi:hypothetical protein ElyMa_004352300 [Elysia marginata]|uniref:Uncharacterized protein n=1 Tax=Elysia marginata TaxID=1093978 RepID=A0AAV4H3C0_9GAST|nr:hypothetical protein ElyMa_004352300 [Elysia marginata]